MELSCPLLELPLLVSKSTCCHSHYQCELKDPPAAPSGVMITSEQYSKTGASVNVAWSTSRGADNYTIRVIQSVMPWETSEFTTTDTSLQLIAVYNVNYSINITAQNCAGRNSTFVPLIVGEIINF